MTSHRCGHVISSARRAPAALPRRRVALIVAALMVGLGPTKFATAYLQVPDEPSPASGTAKSSPKASWTSTTATCVGRLRKRPHHRRQTRRNRRAT